MYWQDRPSGRQRDDEHVRATAHLYALERRLNLLLQIFYTQAYTYTRIHSPSIGYCYKLLFKNFPSLYEIILYPIYALFDVKAKHVFYDANVFAHYVRLRFQSTMTLDTPLKK